MREDYLTDETQTTPLQERLITLIDENGPIRVGDYMADALGHPQHGYYSTQDPFGRGGDFTTAPEISQMFGELIGAWLVDSWIAIGAPSWFNLVEFGPGRGTLMSDILRVGSLRPDFVKAAHIYMVETSGRLRVKQQRRLSDYADQIDWVDKFEDVPSGPLLGVANEFFDCLPIRQFVRTADDSDTPWRERLVGVTGKGPTRQLCYVLSEKQFADRPGMPQGAKPETIFEESPAGVAVVEAMAAQLKQQKGRILMIDYGHGRSGFGETFQAVKRHDVWHPLAMPGRADITAHVDFGALARAARSAEVRVDGPIRQGDFLSRLGLVQRAQALIKANPGKTQQESIEAATTRLISPDGMGTLFKAMALSSPELSAPAGFV